MNDKLQGIRVSEWGGLFLSVHCDGGGTGETFTKGMELEEVAYRLRALADRVENAVWRSANSDSSKN